MIIRRPKGKLKNCKACGKVFVSMAGEEYCPVCLPIELERRHKIDEYMREHKGAPLIEVLKDLKSIGGMNSSYEVEEFLFKERLVEGAPHQNVCASCGTPIPNGLTYCKSCFQAWKSTVQKHSDFSSVNESYSHAPGDPDRAAPIDVAELQRQAHYGGNNKPNRPHGPGQQTTEEKRRPRRYLGIIEHRD